MKESLQIFPACHFSETDTWLQVF